MSVLFSRSVIADTISYRGHLLKFIWNKPAGRFGICVITMMTLLAIFAPWIAPYSPDTQFTGYRLLPAGSVDHWLGTDELSRDILSRVIYGARISLWVGLICAGSGAFIGGLLGLIAAMTGRILDTLIMRVCDLLLAYPGILLGMMIVAMLGSGLMQIGITISLINIPVFARLMRASVLKERELDYIKAAKSQGCGIIRLITYHLLPNSIGGVIPQFTTAAGNAILLEASLSFIGLGIKPPTPSWGSMLSQSRDYLMTSPAYVLVPGIMLMILVYGLNQLSNTVQLALNPMKGE